MYVLRCWAASIALLPLAFGQRVVAIGDVHGQTGPLIQILRAAQVINAADRWTGGKTQVVVSVGRVTPGLADLLGSLQSQADKAGGRVHVMGYPSSVLKIDDSLFVWDAFYRTESDLEDVLREHGVHRIVIGHGDGEKGILPRYRGKLILNDDPEHIGCLVIEDGRPFALYHGRGLALPTDEGIDLARYRRQIAALQSRPPS
jgi:hypothetical protein